MYEKIVKQYEHLLFTRSTVQIPSGLTIFSHSFFLIDLLTQKHSLIINLLQLSLKAPNDWAGRFWGRTGCNAKSRHCLTGDCGNRFQCGGNGGAPPVTLAEITLKGAGGLDYYDISLVDGYNLPVSVSFKQVLFFLKFSSSGFFFLDGSDWRSR